MFGEHYCRQGVGAAAKNCPWAITRRSWKEEEAKYDIRQLFRAQKTLRMLYICFNAESNFFDGLDLDLPFLTSNLSLQKNGRRNIELQQPRPCSLIRPPESGRRSGRTFFVVRLHFLMDSSSSFLFPYVSEPVSSRPRTNFCLPSLSCLPWGNNVRLRKLKFFNEPFLYP